MTNGTVNNRAEEIKDAVGTMIAAWQEWQESTLDVFSEKLENAISAGLNVVLNGDAPAATMPLFRQCVLIGEQWSRVLDGDDGMVDQHGMPVASFFQSLGRLQAIHENEVTAGVRQMEAVSDLLAQMKDYAHKYDQIARMFGSYDEDSDRWFGPFFNPNGTPNNHLIEKEGREPGSVIPRDFNPRAAKQEKVKAAGLTELAKVRQRLAESQRGDKPVGDRASVEQMLREGQYPDVIAAVKGVAESSVRASAAQLGIKIVERDDVLNEAFARYQADGRIADQPYLDAATSGGSASAELDADEPAESSEQANNPGRDLIVADADQDSDSDPDDDADSDADSDSDDDPADELMPLTGDDLKAFCELAIAENPNIVTSEVVAMIRADGQSASPINVGRVLSRVRAENSANPAAV